MGSKTPEVCIAKTSEVLIPLQNIEKILFNKKRALSDSNSTLKSLEVGVFYHNHFGIASPCSLVLLHGDPHIFPVGRDVYPSMLVSTGEGIPS